MNLPEAIIFDYGNTLADAGSLASSASDLTKVEFFKDWQPEHLREIGEHVDSAIRSLYREDQIEQPDYVAVWRAALEASGFIDTDPRLFADGHLKAFAAQQFLFNETTELLRTLFGKNIPLALASNTTGPSRYFEERLEELGIRQYFQLVVFSSDVGSRKPSQHFFDRLIELANWKLPRSDVLLIGDSEIADALGGKRYGFATIRVSQDERTASCADSVMNRNSLLHWANSL